MTEKRVADVPDQGQGTHKHIVFLGGAGVVVHGVAGIQYVVQHVIHHGADGNAEHVHGFAGAQSVVIVTRGESDIHVRDDVGIAEDVLVGQQVKAQLHIAQAICVFRENPHRAAPTAPPGGR
jgi:hypothetical protein